MTEPIHLRTFPARSFSWSRVNSHDADAMATVAGIVSAVRTMGDAALRRYTVQFDGIDAAQSESWSPQVPASALETAWADLPEALQDALHRAADRIREFHQTQLPKAIDLSGDMGEWFAMVWRSLSRVGVYAPGGRAAYPSTVLMNVIPAQVAGVDHIVLASPPQRDTGLPHPYVLAAAHMLGVKDVLCLGGAQAVAAMAYGTETLARVDKVVGPGNLYVALAKRAVMGDVGIDSIAGPSEVFIVADNTADPRYVAADMLAQAEHDVEAGTVLVTTEPTLCEAVEAELNRQLESLPKRDIAAAALARWGAFVVADNLDEAIATVNAAAPEHVEVIVEDPERALSQIRFAGAVFLGPYTPEPVGDYYAGPNHVLPTHGSARFASGLGVLDFLRRMTVVAYTPETLATHSADIVTLAEAEGLHGHARAVTIRQGPL
ncbi:histidinol dehydrogenase [Alicyclobacillus sp. ALC3]|nr:histidinol dehydrogenase [Alicyclobacillus sp. ALC3]